MGDRVLAAVCPEPSGIYGHWWQVVPFFLLAVIGGVTVVYGFVRAYEVIVEIIEATRRNGLGRGNAVRQEVPDGP